jgi:hypothetical protein
MKSTVWLAVAAGTWLGAGGRAAEAQPAKPDLVQATQEKTRRFSEPGPHHKVLERFLGKWQSETRFYVLDTTTTPEKASAEFSWLIEGRWLKASWSGAFGGQPAEGFLLIGYDNFKQNYVLTAVTSLDTRMSRTQGDLDGDALLTYGTFDRYATGESDQMVKQVWRFVSPDKIVFEVHDLGQREPHDKILETTYTRVR